MQTRKETQADIFADVALLCSDAMELNGALNATGKPSDFEWHMATVGLANAFMKSYVDCNNVAVRHVGIDASYMARLAAFCFDGAVRVMVAGWFVYKFKDGSQAWTDSGHGTFTDGPEDLMVGPDRARLAQNLDTVFANPDPVELRKAVADLCSGFYYEGYVQALKDAA